MKDMAWKYLVHNMNKKQKAPSQSWMRHQIIEVKLLVSRDQIVEHQNIVKWAQMVKVKQSTDKE